MTQLRRHRAILAVALALLLCLPALAGEKEQPDIHARLLADTAAIEPGKPFTLGVHLQIPKGWHVYWRNPGDAGMATHVELNLPKGFKSEGMLWPSPETFEESGDITTYGYKKEALLTVRIHPPKKVEAEKLEISARVSWLACKAKCIPGDAKTSLELPVGKARPDNKAVFSQWGKKTPPAAAAFTLKDSRGNDVSLSDFGGKVVVLEWINWDCPFVVRHKKAATMANLAAKYAPKDVVWLGINSTKYHTAEVNADKISHYNLPYPVLDDHPGTVGHLYEAKTTPHMYVIDQAGQVVYAGAIDNDPRGKRPQSQVVNYVDQVLEDVTENRPVKIENQKPYGCSVKYAQ